MNTHYNEWVIAESQGKEFDPVGANSFLLTREADLVITCLHFSVVGPYQWRPGRGGSRESVMGGGGWGGSSVTRGGGLLWRAFCSSGSNFSPFGDDWFEESQRLGWLSCFPQRVCLMFHC